MRIFLYLILLVIVVIGLTFAALNATPVMFNYYIGSRTISLSLLLVYTLGIGIILGMLVSITPVIRLKKQNYSLKNRVKQTEKEIENLRAIPIKDSH